MRQGHSCQWLVNNLICLSSSLSLTHALEGMDYSGTQTKALLGSETITTLCIYCSTKYTSTAIINLLDIPRETFHILERATL